MRSTKFKKLTAIVLAVMLVLSMCITGVSVSAAATDGTEILYLLPNSNWLQSGARFALYTFGDAGDAWTNMTDTDADGVYEVTVPAGDWNGYIFCRMNPNASANNWTNKWNQTADLTVPEGMNCYSVASGTWDKGGGTWSAFTPGTSIETQPETQPVTLPVIEGKADSYYIFGYINGKNYGCEENAANAGEYEFVDGKVTVNFEQDSYIAVKKGDNSVWYMTDGWQGTDKTSVTLYDTTKLGTTADKFYVPAGKEYEVTLVENADGTLTLSYAEPGSVIETDPVETDPVETDPVETDPVETDPVEVGYCLFGYINGANYGCEEDYTTIGDYVFVDGKVTATFAEASYVAVKTTDNVNWYMTDGWAGTVNTVTLYDSSTLDTTADKLMVPAGEVTFTLVENADGTLTLSYVADTVPTIPVETDPVETDPVETDPVEVGYCLFGYINGANYGCEEDYANIGDYVFVDGTVTATFAETSYVAVKTTDNVNWYMTDDWAGEVTEVVLYNTALLDETANKLMVPAGEVTFTLVENADGTLTLSYVAKEVPTDPIPTDPTPTDPTPTEPVLPADKVTIYGDFNVELTEEDTNIYTGTVDLDEGSYEFRVNEFGVKHCYKTTVTDVMEGLRYSDQFGAATTLNATGGRYTFQYNTNSNILVITFKPYSELVELFGDVNVELFRATDTVFSGSARLDAGTYTFRINEMGQQMCFGYTFTDSVVGIEFRPDWTGATTFVATGGIYTINYDTEANKLTFMHAPKGLGEVRIFGSLGIDLAVEKGTSYYSASKVLEAGEYTFRVDEMGTTMCFGGKFTDTMWQIAYSPDYKAATTFNATGGKYTFRYNAETNQLTIFCFAVEEKVSVYGDINLELQSADGVKYTGTTTLEAGTYSFRIDDFGISYCFGGTQTDYISNITYSKDYASATTFIATGGTYSFSYDKNTHKVNVAKIA